jgi:hypothetical protein
MMQTKGNTEMTSLTKDQAVDRLMHLPHADLYESVSDMHKDIHGTRGRYMHSYTVPELVNWWISYYDWNGLIQCWEPIGGFDYDDDPYTTIADHMYYDSCDREERDREMDVTTVNEDLLLMPESKYDFIQDRFDGRRD